MSESQTPQEPNAPVQAAGGYASLFRRMVDLGPQVAPDDPAARNIEALREKFDAVAAQLEAARFGPDGRSVHELPWYVLVGAPGSGNSTVLQNSGLAFPLRAEGEPPQVMGIGGSRYCEWWFTDAAVFIDIAGRYVAHETRVRSDVLAGSAAWHAFLGLMKDCRPSRPISGAVITVSVTDLLLWTKPERQQFAAHVRMRLAELYLGLGTRFPVYLLVTKMDLLAGFAEFFGAMDEPARQQVWGTTFDLGVDPVVSSKAYPADFAVLQERLYAEMLARLEEEPDPVRRASIYRFPQQFHAIGPLVEEMIGLAFSTQVDHQPLMLRGVYFTSATQAGKPIDRVMRTLERAFKLEHKEAEAKGPGSSYFMTRLLREVILPEAALAVDGAGVPATGASSPAPLGDLG
jgi:type VI secretion system protein ImpL